MASPRMPSLAALLGLVDQLTRQTGLPLGELLERLVRALPEAVDQLTPDGRIPHVGV